ncbi:Adenosylhomocysteinase [Actinacidiphila cocklensis]|uniref:Adenosylhomocysteinase n=1 Tax=Actinacidiphila cocklensis TaxID=887465 RepID=A0A9W4EB30_9ACTN|nr:Adenosylhomocysteinase [Actinacidiphila cocklensis]
MTHRPGTAGAPPHNRRRADAQLRIFPIHRRTASKTAAHPPARPGDGRGRLRRPGRRERPERPDGVRRGPSGGRGGLVPAL